MNFIAVHSILVCLFFVGINAHAQESLKKNNKREKVMEFDDSFVEGVNKGPAEYSTKTTKLRDKKGRLYDRELPFEREMAETLRDMRFAE